MPVVAMGSWPMISSWKYLRKEWQALAQSLVGLGSSWLQKNSSRT